MKFKTCGFALALSLLASAYARGEEPVSILRGPYLQLATPESITIVWRADQPTDPSVRYGLRVDAMTEEADDVFLRVAPVIDGEVTRQPFGRLHSAPANTYQYEVTLTGLQPDTKYFYSVWDGDTPLAGGDERHYFRTHPPIGESRPTRIWVVGDSGTGASEQAAVYKAAREIFEAPEESLDLYLHVGDMAYAKGKDAEFQENFFDIYQPTLRNTVVWAAMGNHEGLSSSGKTEDGPFFDAYVSPTGGEAGGVPSGSEAYYSFDYGNIHFVCLNSHDLDRHADSLMARWLERDLREATADWLIAYWHHPPYTKGKDDSDLELQLIEMREQIMPILEAHGVDLVLTGHSHVYERSMLMDKAYPTPTTNVGAVLDDGDGRIGGDGAYRKSEGLNPHEGTVQIVTGHGGAPGVGRRGAMPIMRQTLVEHGSMLIDIEGDTLTARMIGASGGVRDEFSIVKKGTVHPKIVMQPWTPVGPKMTPAGGPFPDDRRVELSVSGYWAGGEIRYTLDGSEPTRDSALYTAPITLPPDAQLAVVKARSFKGRTQPTLSTIAYFKDYGPDIPRARNVITVDGRLDDWEEWEGETIRLDRESQLTSIEGWEGASDLSAEIMLAWAPEGLYFAVSVTDDIYLPATHELVQQFDSLMFMIDGRTEESRSDSSLGHGAYMIMLGADARGGRHYSRSYTPEFDSYEVATQRGEEGYVTEFFVPFSEELFPDQGFDVGRTLQLAVVILEHDEPGRAVRLDGLYWAARVDRGARKDSSFWMPVRLGP